MSRAVYFAPVTPPPPGTYLGGHPIKGLLMTAFGWDDDTAEIEISGPEVDAVLRALGRIEADRIARLVERLGRIDMIRAGEAPERAELAAARECFDALEELRSALRAHPDGLRLFLAD